MKVKYRSKYSGEIWFKMIFKILVATNESGWKSYSIADEDLILTPKAKKYEVNPIIPIIVLICCTLSVLFFCCILMSESKYESKTKIQPKTETMLKKEWKIKFPVFQKCRYCGAMRKPGSTYCELCGAGHKIDQ